MGMAKPLHAPTQKPVVSIVTELVQPTAASATVPRKRPTMIVSTNTYSC